MKIPPEMLAEIDRAKIENTGPTGLTGPMTERAGTELVVRAEAGYTTGVEGLSTVKIYQSFDDEDRGGVVIDVEIDNHGGGGFSPDCEVLCGGAGMESGTIRITLLGDAESTSVLIALKKAIEAIEHRLLQKDAIDHLSISVPHGFRVKEPVL